MSETLLPEHAREALTLLVSHSLDIARSRHEPCILGIAMEHWGDILSCLRRAPSPHGQDVEALVRDLHRLDLKYHEAIGSPYLVDMTITDAIAALRSRTQEPREDVRCGQCGGVIDVRPAPKGGGWSAEVEAGVRDFIEKARVPKRAAPSEEGHDGR